MLALLAEVPRRARGVEKKGSRYQARIRDHGSNLYLGTFDTLEEAARAYDATARKLGRDEASLNFPRGSITGTLVLPPPPSFAGLTGVRQLLNGRFEARIKYKPNADGKPIWESLGVYNTAAEASRAYNVKVSSLRSEGKQLSSPPETEAEKKECVAQGSAEAKRFKYVYYRSDMRVNTFRARVTHKTVRYNVGSFETAEAAAHAVDAKLGELGLPGVNFP